MIGLLIVVAGAVSVVLLVIRQCLVILRDARGPVVLFVRDSGDHETVCAAYQVAARASRHEIGARG